VTGRKKERVLSATAAEWRALGMQLSALDARVSAIEGSLAEAAGTDPAAAAFFNYRDAARQVARRHREKGEA
jgi:hypothetical protein